MSRFIRQIFQSLSPIIDMLCLLLFFILLFATLGACSTALTFSSRCLFVDICSLYCAVGNLTDQ